MGSNAGNNLVVFIVEHQWPCFERRPDNLESGGIGFLYLFSRENPEAPIKIEGGGAWPQQGVQGVVVSQAQPASQMMQVQCPQGAGPGTMIQIADSYGRLMQVQVPQGVYPGQTFMIQT